MKQLLPFLPLPCQPPVCVLSLWIYPLLDICINEVIFLTFCVWLLYCSVIFWKFIHVVACRMKQCFIPFYWVANIPLYVYTQFVIYTYHDIYIPQTLFWAVPPSVARHLGYFHLLTFVSSAAKNMCVYCLFEYLFSILLGIYLGKLLGLRQFYVLSLRGTAKLFSIVAEPLYTPTSNIQGSSFSSFSPFVFCLFVFIILVGINWYLIMVLICVSPMTNDFEHLFLYLYLVCHLGRIFVNFRWVLSF